MNLDGKDGAAKPFLKWAGGKSQLWPIIQDSLPSELTAGALTYVEPFIGGGAILIRLLANYPAIQQAILNDINPDLYQAYQTTRQQPEELIQALWLLQNSYDDLGTEIERRIWFDEARLEFNRRDLGPLRNTALLIALNKTCFNGLYRVNSKGKFNVPFGRYERPRICDPQTIRASSHLLQRVTILQGDFSQTLRQVRGRAFFYMDPPYKPLSATANFNSYASEVFNDASQQRLAAFCQELDAAGHLWLLSNSDMRNTDQENSYFDDLYRDYHIQRVQAKRAINSVGNKRGAVDELLITNYIP